MFSILVMPSFSFKVSFPCTVLPLVGSIKPWQSGKEAIKTIYFVLHIYKPKLKFVFSSDGSGVNLEILDEALGYQGFLRSASYSMTIGAENAGTGN